MRPELEKAGLLHSIALPDARRRPADVLICHGTVVLTGLPGESVPRGLERVALDFSVVNALGQGHHAETSRPPLTAALLYSRRKCSYAQTATRCAAAGIAFEPMVFELQGGVEPRAAAILHRIASCVASCEGLPVAECKRQFFDRLALIIARRASSMVRRRCSRQPPGFSAGARSVAELALAPPLEAVTGAA